MLFSGSSTHNFAGTGYPKSLSGCLVSFYFVAFSAYNSERARRRRSSSNGGGVVLVSNWSGNGTRPIEFEGIDIV